MSWVAVGQWNPLTVVRASSRGAYVDGGKDGELLISPAPTIQPVVGEVLNLFVYRDHKDALVATDEAPLAEVGQVALLRVLAKTSAGYFLDWGLPKDLLLPFNETIHALEAGDEALVMVFRDDQGRVAASMKLSDFIADEGEGLRAEQEVDLVIAATTDLGVKAVVNQRFWGLIYHADVPRPLAVGEKVKGYVRRVREEDKRVDLSLSPVGVARLDHDSEKILALLRSHQGHMALGDKSPPVAIKRITGMSKRAFKQACGRLYKQGLLLPSDNEIRLTDKGSQQ